MSITENVPAERPPVRLLDELTLRLRGPGGYYNIGNVIGLATALGLQLAGAIASGRSGFDAVVGCFVGSPQALAFTLSSLIFIWSGETYHRAFKDGAPDVAQTRIADLLSALGSIALAVSLILLGQAVLAIAAGTLMVLGKLGSASFGDDAVAPPLWPSGWPDPFRLLVLASRLPAIAAPGFDLLHQLAVASPAIALVQPVVLIVCQMLWARADLLLLDCGRGTAPAARAPG